MKFVCRYVKPTVGTWFTLDSADSLVAVMDFHHENDRGLKYIHWLNSEKTHREFITFGLVAVKRDGDPGDGEEFVARNYFAKITRRGGVKCPGHDITLVEIAQQLGYTFDPETLLDSGWDEEQENWK